MTLHSLSTNYYHFKPFNTKKTFLEEEGAQKKGQPRKIDTLYTHIIYIVTRNTQE